MVIDKWEMLRNFINNLIEDYDEDDASILRNEMEIVLDYMDHLEQEEMKTNNPKANASFAAKLADESFERFQEQVASENDSLSESSDNLPGHHYWTGIPTFDRIAWDKIKERTGV